MAGLWKTCLLAIAVSGCAQSSRSKPDVAVILHTTDTMEAWQEGRDLSDSMLLADTTLIDTLQSKVPTSLPPSGSIDTRDVNPEELVQYAHTLIGVPYVYGATNPTVGFDCSGFITYVFNHFQIKVPRSSIEFTNVGREVAPEEAKPGDLILFTGTNPLERFVGHMGIVSANADSLRFIHSTSGKAMGVTVTALNDYYKGRYVKIVRVFP